MEAIPNLLLWAWLLPLISFMVVWLSFSMLNFLGQKTEPVSRYGAYVATGAIGSSAVLSVIAFLIWLGTFGVFHEGEHAEEHASAGSTPITLVQHVEEGGVEHAAETPGGEESHTEHVPPSISGEWYTLGQFGELKVGIGYFVDALTITMFCMVSLIATLIHVYATGYMHDELHDITDHEITLRDGHHLHRKGRYHRFFQYLSLFCFSMLGIVIAGNIAMVFVFWELVGICSYFLIGFYFERQSASTAANKAFIVNRVGDFGMIIGLMALFGALGTFNFGDELNPDGTMHRAGIFSQVRPAENHHHLLVPEGMARQSKAEGPLAGYGLLMVAGLGIFCGCVGKSAQFPLHVWLPDAMEGPTPVSALVHSATMVAAGVYLVGRFFPVFTPEVLLIIAYTGCITLFMAATIAITATDIKRVLAYSTVSQLGYMMLALGLGGWVAGMFHLITHAFFKSLLFMCSGSVIHAVHTNEMPLMGGLRKKMPITAYTMLVGCLAIAGAGIPFVIGFSGYYSKDAILEQGWNFMQRNPAHGILLWAAAGGAAITAFYMFRLWYMTFAGHPRDHHRYDHAHESPSSMWGPLVVLSVFAVAVAWPFTGWTGGWLPSLTAMLEQARPAGTLGDQAGALWTSITVPDEHASHAPAIVVAATLLATATALTGFAFATAFYGLGWLKPEEVRNTFRPLYRFLVHKWWFDELYDFVFVQPAMFFSRRVAGFDRNVIDWLIDSLAVCGKAASRWLDRWVDRPVVDGTFNGIAKVTYDVGLKLRTIQTGNLRQYVMFIVLGTVVLFMLISFAGSFSVAGP